MLKELNVYLKGNMSEDYWYDDALFICEEILGGFSKYDWEVLLKSMSNETNEWKKRLVECLGDIHNSYELKVILELINTDNEELMIACIDSLRSVDLSKLDKSIKKQLQGKINKLLIIATPPVKKVLEDFLQKE